MSGYISEPNSLPAKKKNPRAARVDPSSHYFRKEPDPQMPFAQGLSWAGPMLDAARSPGEPARPPARGAPLGRNREPTLPMGRVGVQPVLVIKDTNE